MRAVVDTNVLISGLLWRGVPHRLIACARDGRVTLLSSPTLLAEFTRVIARPSFAGALERAGVSVEQVADLAGRLLVIHQTAPLPRGVSRDPDDDAVLAVAVSARADLVVSGDQDLLVLGDYRGVPILRPVEALALIETGR